MQHFFTDSWVPMRKYLFLSQTLFFTDSDRGIPMKTNFITPFHQWVPMKKCTFFITDTFLSPSHEKVVIFCHKHFFCHWQGCSYEEVLIFHQRHFLHWKGGSNEKKMLTFRHRQFFFTYWGLPMRESANFSSQTLLSLTMGFLCSFFVTDTFSHWQGYSNEKMLIFHLRHYFLTDRGIPMYD